MNESLKRKSNRIKNYDYSQEGAYFITICTKNHMPLLGEIIVETNSIGLNLSDIGAAIDKAIVNIPKIYDMVEVVKYVIMPNHVHLILLIKYVHDEQRRTLCAPTVSRVIKHLKGHITKLKGSSLWQKSFHDHIIRNQDDYDRITEYIENNPAKWTEDQYYLK